MTVETRRKLRLLIVVLFIISTSVAGFLWGNSREDGAIAGAIVLTGVSLLLMLAAETLITITENEIVLLTSKLRETSEELDIYKGKVTELDRTIAIMLEDNDEFRREILLEKMHELPGDAKKTDKN